MKKPAGANAIRYPVHPRLIPPTKAARFLHLTLAEFHALLPALHSEGFPAACRITGHYDLVAIEAWQDRRSGLTTVASVPTDLDALIRERLAKL